MESTHGLTGDLTLMCYIKHYKYSSYFTPSEMCVGEPGGIGTAYAEHGREQQDYVE